MKRKLRAVSCLLFGLAAAVMAQQPPAQPKPEVPAQPSRSFRPTYVLGANDQVLIRAENVEELGDKPYAIDAEGYLTVPVVGRIKVAGLTVEGLEALLIERLKAEIVNPRVTVTIVQFRSEPIFVVGPFKSPGIHPLEGRRTLIEMLSRLGGLEPNAGHRIRITRRLDYGKIPLPNATEDRTAGTSSVEINLNNLMETVNPAEDIELQPFDLIAASTKGMVYTTGEVTKSGAFELNDREFLPVTQLLALAGGYTKDAALDKAVVLRPILDTPRRAGIVINLRAVLAGQENDFPLLANDMLVIPRSHGALTFVKGLEFIAPTILSTIITLIAIH